MKKKDFYILLRQGYETKLDPFLSLSKPLIHLVVDYLVDFGTYLELKYDNPECDPRWESVYIEYFPFDEPLPLWSVSDLTRIFLTLFEGQGTICDSTFRVTGGVCIKRSKEGGMGVRVAKGFGTLVELSESVRVSPIVADIVDELESVMFGLILFF